MNLIHSSIKTIVTIILFIIDSLVLLISKILSKKENSNKILMVNLGALGDNLIFLNSLLAFDKNKEIVILVDEKCELLFENQMFNNIYYINRKKYIQNIFYRSKINIIFSRYRFSKIINTRGSRNGIYEDSLIRFIDGEKIALTSDYSSNSKISLKIFDKLVYDKILMFEVNSKIHEIERIYFLLNNIFETNKELNLIKIDYCFDELLKKRKIEKKYFVLNIGAGKKFRKWDIEKYILLSNKLEEKLNLVPVYCGLKEDRFLLENSKNTLTKNSINLCGKTNLSELINIINFSEFAISNDSAAAHLSIFLKKRTICIKSKFDENRFFPYPNNLMNEDIAIISKKSINEIDIEDVLNKCFF